MTGLSDFAVRLYEDRNPGGSTRWFKFEQILMLI